MSLVMAFLNGRDVPDLLRMRTLVTKFIGSVCSCAANLTLGTEGPLVHMGACIASVIALMECGMTPSLSVLLPLSCNAVALLQQQGKKYMHLYTRRL